MKLSQDTEEVATFYGRMLDHDYTTKEVFNKNFFKDWRKIMNDKEKDVIRSNPDLNTKIAFTRSPGGSCHQDRGVYFVNFDK